MHRKYRKIIMRIMKNLNKIVISKKKTLKKRRQKKSWEKGKKTWRNEILNESWKIFLFINSITFFHPILSLEFMAGQWMQLKIFLSFVVVVVLILFSDHKKDISIQPLSSSTLPPVAEKIPHTIQLHGKDWNDEYYWLRERESEKVLDYLKAENAYTSGSSFYLFCSVSFFLNTKVPLFKKSVFSQKVSVKKKFHFFFVFFFLFFFSLCFFFLFAFFFFIFPFFHFFFLFFLTKAISFRTIKTHWRISKESLRRNSFKD